jgi:hypothetical protein
MTRRMCIYVAVVSILSTILSKSKFGLNREIAVQADAVGGTMGEGSAKPC